MKGKIIVIDGMDGTGKATQSKLLYEDLKNRGMKVKLFTFPNYDSDSSYFVKKYLREGYSRDIDNPMLHSIYFSIDRAITYAYDIKKYYEDGYIIILDRYIISNVICNLHRCIGIDNMLVLDYVRNLSTVENVYLDLPYADLNIILQADPEISSKLMDNRYDNDKSKRDLNENIQHQRLFYQNIEYISGDRSEIFEMHLGPSVILKINCHDSNGDPIVYTEDEMHFKIMYIINDKFELYLDIE